MFVFAHRKPLHLLRRGARKERHPMRWRRRHEITDEMAMRSMLHNDDNQFDNVHRGRHSEDGAAADNTN